VFEYILDYWSLRSDICLTRKILESRNLSTQFIRQLSSPRENRVEGVLVMHLKEFVSLELSKSENGDRLVPTHSSKVVNS